MNENMELSTKSMTEVDDYQPTPIEQKILETLLDPTLRDKSRREKCQIGGFSHESLYRALRKPEFLKLLNDMSMNLIRDRIHDVLDASVQSATKGGSRGYQDRRMLLEMYGLVVRQDENRIVIVNIKE